MNGATIMDHDMHHPAPDKSAEPDHNKTIQPMHHGGDSGPHQPGTGAHVHDLEDFKKRFIISTIITIPILLLSPVIQSFFGFRFDFPGSDVCYPGTCLHCLFLWRVSVPQRDFPGVACPHPGHDDTDRGGDQRGVFLQRCRGVRSEG